MNLKDLRKRKKENYKCSICNKEFKYIMTKNEHQKKCKKILTKKYKKI